MSTKKRPRRALHPDDLSRPGWTAEVALARARMTRALLADAEVANAHIRHLAIDTGAATGDIESGIRSTFHVVKCVRR